MGLLGRVLAAVGALTLALPAVAHADDDVTPVRRISCPSASHVSAASGYDVISLTATHTSCWYEGAPDPELKAPRQRIEFSYTKDRSLDAAHARALAWDAEIQPAPELGDAAFSWQVAGPANLYWEVSPGAIGTLSGIDDHAKAVATARLFRPQMEVYTVPGEHTVGGRLWRTTCEPYSDTTRCRTEIWAHSVLPDGDSFRHHKGWTFNSLTYLWSKRSMWAGNPLATPGTWRSDGQLWRTDCDSAATGRGACRTWLWQPAVERIGDSYRVAPGWVFNNQVLFS